MEIWDMNSDTQKLRKKTAGRNACAPSAALHLRLARSKGEALVVALERAEAGDPSLRYALAATRSEALTTIDHINLMLRAVAS
jgi:hypothetical protein